MYKNTRSFIDFNGNLSLIIMGEGTLAVNYMYTIYNIHPPFLELLWFGDKLRSMQNAATCYQGLCWYVSFLFVLF